MCTYKITPNINVVGHIQPLSKRPVSWYSFDIRVGTLGQYIIEIGIIL